MTQKLLSIMIGLALIACDDGSETTTGDASVEGACCADGCTIATARDCTGLFLEATACEPDPCPTGAVGACCTMAGACTLREANACLATGGSFVGEGRICAEDTCPAPERGACCSPLSACEVLDEQTCFGRAWTFIGDGARCDPDPCPVREVGACCEDGECTITDRPRCDGDFVLDAVCAPNPCEQPVEPDASLPDAAVPDAAVPDAAVPDAALPDAATPDAALLDAAPADAAVDLSLPDADPSDAAIEMPMVDAEPDAN